MADEISKIFPGPNATSNPGFTRLEPLITPQDVKDVFLWGIPLIDPSGNEMPIKVIEHHHRAAISRLEHKLNITITPTQYVDLRDYRAEDYDHWFFLQMDHRPISPNIDDVSVQIQYIRDETLIELPKAWYRIYSEAGQIQMTPTSGTMGQFYVSAAGIILPGVWGIKKDYPQMIKVTYIAGFEQDKIPAMINQWIGYATAVEIMQMVGDVILGMPGVASYGIGLDGLSQSLTREGFAQRIANYRTEMETLSHELIQYYKPVMFSSL